MKGIAKSRLFMLALITLAMMAGLILQLGRLTITEGDMYAAQAASRRTTTMYTTGARGRILDRNGIPLAYDETSYNVQFYRDPERLSPADSALYTEALLTAISIIEAGGGTTIDTSYIRMDEQAELYYNWGVEAPASQKARYLNFCNAMGFTMPDPDDTSTWISAKDAYRKLRQLWKIPEELPFSEAVKLMSIRQEVNMNKWRAYEPVTIAFNVPMEVVAELDMRAEELLGIRTMQSTSRVYPWGTTAAHILGYLSRQVSDEMSVTGMQRMGYAQEDYNNIPNIFAKDKDGSQLTGADGGAVVQMTKLGYSYNDYIGVAGVERTMEKHLSASTNNQRGTKIVEINKHGTVTRELEKTPPSNGNDVMLTIDLSLQKVTEAALENAILKINGYEKLLLQTKPEYYLKRRQELAAIKTAQSGSIVVLDIHTGKVLAMASYPSFDPNSFIRGLTEAELSELGFGENPVNPNMPTLNRAIASRLAPGSIFKMATGLAGLMEGKITTTSLITDGGKYTKFVDGDEIKESEAPECWIYPGRHGSLTLSEALSVSCNYYFFTVADRVGIQKLNEWATHLGLNDQTGIELPGELSSHVGGQKVLYDNTADLKEQKSSLPGYVFRQLEAYLKAILKERNVEIDNEAISKCSQELLKLQTGSTQSEFGPDIRRILREELGLPIGITRTQDWVPRISSMLTELQWKPAMTIRSGIGQATTLVTPVAVARYAAAFGNGGTVYDVHIVDRILNEKGSVVKVYEPSVFEKIEAPDEYWAAIRDGLKGVVSPEDGGTAAQAFSKGFDTEGYLRRIIGKSGTAQISTSKVSNVDIENTSWFVTLLPREAPEIVIITCIPYGFSGSRAGGPAVEEITRYYLDRKSGMAKDNLVPVNGLIP